MKSFQPKTEGSPPGADGPGDPPGDTDQDTSPDTAPAQSDPETAPMPSPSRRHRNAEVDFRGEKRSNATHASTTDPDARLFRKSRGTGAVLCYMGHALMEFEAQPATGSRAAPKGNGFVVQADLTRADGHADPKKTSQPWTLAFCWTHWRRRFVKFGQDTPSPICDEMIARIASLYAIEKEIRGRDPATRRAVRQKISRPIVEALRPWLEACLQDLSSVNELARHIRYGLKRWDGLTRPSGPSSAFAGSTGPCDRCATGS